MICDTLTLPDGTRAIVCSSGNRKGCACGRRADLLCDWKVPTRKSGTCDAPICSSCTTSPAPDKDLCPTHAAAFADWQAQHRPQAQDPSPPSCAAPVRPEHGPDASHDLCGRASLQPEHTK